VRDPDDAMPPRRRETMSGITVIRMALTQSAPIGSTHATTVPLQDASTEARPRPAASPSTSPVSTATVSDLCIWDLAGGKGPRRGGRT